MTNGDYQLHTESTRNELDQEPNFCRHHAVILGKLPASFRDDPTPRVDIELKKGEHKYTCKAIVHARQFDIQIFEARFITFNIFGDRTGILSALEVEYIRTIKDREYNWDWPLHDENNKHEAKIYSASVAFIERAVTKDGNVYTADHQSILRKLQDSAFPAEVTEADFQIDPEKP